MAQSFPSKVKKMSTPVRVSSPPHEQTWQPLRVKDLSSEITTGSQTPEIEGWQFDRPETSLRIHFKKLGSARLQISTQVIAASAQHITLICTDPFLLVLANQNPQVHFNLQFFDREVKGLSGRIKHIDLDKGICHIHLNTTGRSDYLDSLGLHVLRHGLETTPRAILDRGARLPNLEKHFEYRTITTKQEFDAVLALRTQAYAEVGKHTGDSHMTDAFDSNAIIVIGTLFGQVIASLRIMPHAATDLWEHDRFITWSDELPPRSESVEITRVCVAPAFRKSNVLMGLFHRTALLILVSNRRYLYSGPRKLDHPLRSKRG
jgi:hypothetical protein